MGSDWGTHGEESYPEAAWLQLEVCGFIFKAHLLGTLNLIFPSIGSQEGVPANGQFPFNIASDQVSVFC